MVVPHEAWDWSKVPAHLKPTFRVVDDDGGVRRRGQGPRRAASDRCARASTSVGRPPPTSGLSATGQTAWTFGTIEPTFMRSRAGHEVRGYPALVDEGGTVGLRVLGSEDEQQAVHRRGLRRLLLLALPSPPSSSPTGSTTPTSWGWPPRRTRRSPA